DINGNILDVNDSYCKMIGYTREEIIHMTIPDIESMETQTETAQHLRKIVEQRGDRFETRHRRKDGRTIDIEASVNYMELGSGYFFAFLRDITARKAAEKTIQRVNTALRTLSEANHALLHTNDEQELLDRICKIIVNNGGYRLAWVGYAEHDEGKTVRPVAYAGYEEGYLEKLNITWAETKYGMGPTGNAIRTGKPSVARKMMTDPTYIPWREEALKLGYTSSIALPLIAEGKSLGALNIYSSDKASFDTEEVKLLNDLAENLSFDIMGIRMKAEHNHILQELIKAEERLRHLLISNPAVIYSARADGDYGATFISENIHEQLGWRSSDFIGDSGFWAKNIHPDDSQRILTDFPKVFDHGIHIHEYRFRHKNGSWRWMHDEMKLIKDREGKPIEIVGYWVDITNHKQIEEELLETKANLESTVAKRTEQLVEANESLKTTIVELEQRNQESTLINEMADMLLVSTRQFNNEVQHLGSRKEKC
ncbi:MAG: PAS domain S-box protein, partial [Nitrospinota bacterium]